MMYTLKKIKNDISKFNNNTSEALDYLLEITKKDKISLSKSLQGLTIFQLIEKFKTEPLYKQKTSIEFSFWFLKYNAQRVFHHHINTKGFKGQINSNLTDNYINNELTRIESLEKEALEHTNNPYHNYNDRENHLYLFNDNYKQIEIKRVLSGNYYKENHTPNKYTVIRSPEVLAYFEHILLKPYLKGLLIDIGKEESSKNDYNKYKTLKNIFKNKDDFESCINELRTAEPPIINSKRKYLLGDKKKGAIVAWIDALEIKDFINKPKDDVLAQLLIGYFENFSITGRSLRGDSSKAYIDYYKHFRNALPQPKK